MLICIIICQYGYWLYSYDVPSSLPFPSLSLPFPSLPSLPSLRRNSAWAPRGWGGATFTSVPSTPVASGIQDIPEKIFHLPLEVIVLIVPILTFLVRAWWNCSNLPRFSPLDKSQIPGKIYVSGVSLEDERWPSQFKLKVLCSSWM